ncbi:FAD binding domain-containing protein [Kallotenue papyrolyticum]|uniref:FAD binding domain-containing protein n=1 Tax=Kallotenue papyrolyticum TaxID=1325125 RepID=UPI00047865B7|nr:xanthine dehydrogenase family protein subunit M [Kallotenue papyrolyticum]
MYPNNFEYAAPATLQEALDLLSQNAEAKVLAGGHSLLPMMKIRLANPGMLVDLRKIAELKGIQVDGEIRVGAMTTYAELERSEELRQRLPVIAECVNVIGDPAVRNRGTIGGSLAHADPAADMPALMLALEAQMRVRGPNGERTIAAADFFVDMLQSALEPGEILTEIVIPLLPQGAGAAYEKFKHPASGYAVVGVAAVVQRGDGGQVSACRIAVTGAGPRAQRARAAEEALVSSGNLEDAAAKAADGLDLIGDAFASEEFRAHLTRVLTRRALKRAMERAG